MHATTAETANGGDAGLGALGPSVRRARCDLQPLLDPAARQAILDQIPVRRIATVEDVAHWYVFLASDRASYSTGSIFTVDGGLDAQQMAVRPITDAER